MEEIRKVCSNPWCKATFIFTEIDMKEVNGNLVEPDVCQKCISFDTELSGGVTWDNKEYEGDRYDPTPHQFKYKIKNFF